MQQLFPRSVKTFFFISLQNAERLSLVNKKYDIKFKDVVIAVNYNKYVGNKNIHKGGLQSVFYTIKARKSSTKSFKEVGRQTVSQLE